MFVLVANFIRSAARWAWGRRGSFDLTNRRGDAMRPGREDYAVVLSHDPLEPEPAIDWADAYYGFEPVAQVTADAGPAASRLVASHAASSEPMQWKEVG